MDGLNTLTQKPKGNPEFAKWVKVTGLKIGDQYNIADYIKWLDEQSAKRDQKLQK